MLKNKEYRILFESYNLHEREATGNDEFPDQLVQLFLPSSVLFGTRCSGGSCHARTALHTSPDFVMLI